jgi:hypothetical protein
VPREVGIYAFELGTTPFKTVLGAGVRSASRVPEHVPLLLDTLLYT